MHWPTRNSSTLAPFKQWFLFSSWWWNGCELNLSAEKAKSFLADFNYLFVTIVKSPNQYTMNIYNNPRLKSLGVTPQTNSINVMNPSADTGSKYIPNQEIFTLSKEGNIHILYTSIDRHLIQYEVAGNGKMSQYNSKLKTFRQIRLKEPIGNMKYKIPKGAGTHPFFPPLLQNHFEKKEKIETNKAAPLTLKPSSQSLPLPEFSKI